MFGFASYSKLDKRGYDMRGDYKRYADTYGAKIKITQHDYLVLNRISKLLKKCVNKYLEKNAAVLDLGCGKKPYKQFFLGKSVTYIGIDIFPSKFLDILCSGGKLPFKDNVFSACICTQVLEHVDDPKAVVDEIFRVLKPNGILFLSTHGNWPVHDAPHDFWRWTEYGLMRLLTNFRIQEIQADTSAMSLIQLFELYIPGKSLGVIVIIFLNKLGDLLDRNMWLNAKLPRLATNYFVIARKAEKLS